MLQAPTRSKKDSSAVTSKGILIPLKGSRKSIYEAISTSL